MPGEINIEQIIREAMDKGEFDDLKGKGKPLDLDAYFSAPEDLRMGHALLRSNEYLPEEVEMLREIADLKERLAASTDEAERGVLTKKLNDRQLAFTIAMEKYKRKR